MEIDDSGWPDLELRLHASAHDTASMAALVAYLEAQLVGHFGADTVECWLGKDGARKHAMREVAAAAIAHLMPAFDRLEPAAMARLLGGEFGIDTPPP